MTMLSVAAAQTRLFGLAHILEIETVSLVEAVGRWAAQPVAATRDQPSRDLSAMDGYAIRYSEMPGPWRVVGESAAGAAFAGSLVPGEAVRIFTGAPVPAGADTILVQEETARNGDLLTVTGEGPPRSGSSVRPRATDFATGAVLIAEGERIDARRVALAAIGGHGDLAVRRRPRVALISTGDELVTPGTALLADQLPASNALMIESLLIGWPAIVEDRGIIADDLDAIAQGFLDASCHADIIVTTGGVSVGDRDLVRPALEKAGAQLDFWRVAMRPGKPLLAGKLGNTLVLGLPGNPVSSYVTARLFLLPLIARMGGAAEPLPRGRTVTLGAPLPANGARQDYLRARVENGRAYAPDGQDSSHLFALARADGLLVRGPGAAPGEVGDLADMFYLD